MAPGDGSGGGTTPHGDLHNFPPPHHLGEQSGGRGRGAPSIGPAAPHSPGRGWGSNGGAEGGQLYPPCDRNDNTPRPPAPNSTFHIPQHRGGGCLEGRERAGDTDRQTQTGRQTAPGGGGGGGGNTSSPGPTGPPTPWERSWGHPGGTPRPHLAPCGQGHLHPTPCSLLPAHTSTSASWVPPPAPGPEVPRQHPPQGFTGAAAPAIGATAHPAPRGAPALPGTTGSTSHTPGIAPREGGTSGTSTRHWARLPPPHTKSCHTPQCPTPTRRLTAGVWGATCGVLGHAGRSQTPPPLPPSAVLVPALLLGSVRAGAVPVPVPMPVPVLVPVLGSIRAGASAGTSSSANDSTGTSASAGTGICHSWCQCQ